MRVEAKYPDLLKLGSELSKSMRKGGLMRTTLIHSKIYEFSPNHNFQFGNMFFSLKMIFLSLKD
jgi:hypothetical protein